ncbi:MAG TPA: hypothetical protein VLD63_15510 [Anaerolineales bacterium]|nr:hypothetical protein [Anaerolineales bacterium]
MRSSTLIRLFGVLAGLQFLFAVFAFVVLTAADPIAHARIGMGLGLYLFWIMLGGMVMLAGRGPIATFVQTVRLGWRVKFVLFCTLLAMAEEAVAVAMTNAAPLFGLKIGEAYITASANYWDVILGHSVIVFVPMFIAWAWLLGRYRFTPNQVFLLFGLTGTLAEATYGPQHLLEIGMWMFVYGLMVYLPAYSVPQDRQGRDARWFHYPLAVVVPFLFLILLLPVVPLLRLLRPSIETSFPGV